MNQTKYTVYYTLLIVCLSVGLASVFLPFLLIGDKVGAVSVFSFLRIDETGSMLRDSFSDYKICMYGGAVLGFLSVVFLFRSISFGLQDLHKGSTPFLGIGPWIGMLLSAVQLFDFLIVSIDPYELPSALQRLRDDSVALPVVPILRLVVLVCAVRLCQGLDRTEIPSEQRILTQNGEKP